MGPLTSNCPALVSQVSQVPQVPLVSILLTRSMCSTTNSSCGKFFGGEGVKIELPKFLMVGKSLIIISFTISFDWKLSGELIARGVNLNIRDKTSQELTYHDCAAPHCWPEFSNRFQALESRVNHRRYFSVVWERWQQQCFRLAICASLKLRFDPNYEHHFQVYFQYFQFTRSLLISNALWRKSVVSWGWARARPVSISTINLCPTTSAGNLFKYCCRASSKL